MKKTLLLISFIFLNYAAFAQFEIRNYDDDTIVTDGETISFSETGCGYNDSCNWRFKVTNTSATETLYMKIFVDNMVNSDGSNVQLCFSGTCLNSVNLGTGYPTNTPATIAPNSSTGTGNYFWNQNPTDTTTPMSWTLRFQAYDASGFTVGSPLSVTYSFDPNLSVEEEEFTSVEIFPTQVKDELTVSTNKNLTAEIYDILGKKVKQVNVLSGESTIDVRDLTSQLYIIRFKSVDGNTLTKKIIVE
jgi:hypothetical protein